MSEVGDRYVPKTPGERKLALVVFRLPEDATDDDIAVAQKASVEKLRKMLGVGDDVSQETLIMLAQNELANRLLATEERAKK